MPVVDFVGGPTCGEVLEVETLTPELRVPLLNRPVPDVIDPKRTAKWHRLTYKLEQRANGEYCYVLQPPEPA